MSTSTPQSRTTIELFDDLADLFDEFSKALDTVERPLGAWMAANLPKGRRALDIGCGAGRHSLLLAELYEEVVAADPSPSMIEIAERDRPRPNITYQVRDAFDLKPEADGRFAVVYAFSCVFHMAEPAVILPHLASLVAPGGQLVIFDPQRPPDYGQEGWEVEYAFSMGRMAYELTGQLETAVSMLRTFTHPSWLEISRRNVPLSPEEFRQGYTAALPGVRIDDQIFPGFMTARWTAPAG
jgi:SAM-dependent methyltransferase